MQGIGNCHHPFPYKDRLFQHPLSGWHDDDVNRPWLPASSHQLPVVGRRLVDVG